MRDDARTDEALIAAYLAGDNPAFGALFERYFNPLMFYIPKVAWFDDKQLFEDIVHQSFLKVLEAVKSGRFKPLSAGRPAGLPDIPGKFRSYLFETCQNICWQENKKRSRCKTASSAFPDEPAGIPDDILSQRDTDTPDYDYYRIKLQEALPKLNAEEQRLLKLLTEGEGMSYQDIHDRDPILGKHPVDYLMRMMYIIKKKIKEMPALRVLRYPDDEVDSGCPLNMCAAI